MNIKSKAEEILSRIKSDQQFSSKFQHDPAAAIESAVGINLPNDQVNALIGVVKARLAGDHAGELLGSLKKLF
ncbi:hypothetical protein [Cohnella sp. 56]|uniref:hypothetical protein n=1 Tax=Cohnella sp. 56 TaxID=3113722 RepID=UPI0030E83933